MKNRWVKVIVNKDSGAARHVMPEGMFPRVKVERNISPKRFVSANGEQIRGLSEKAVLFKEFEDAQRSELQVLSNLSFQCRQFCECSNNVRITSNLHHQ